MQSTTFAFLAISVCVYLSCTFTTVYGKCSGRWAIHACYGGNGKRSGPPDTDTDSKLKERQYILRQLLLSEKLPNNLSTDSQFDTAPILEDVESLYPDVASSYNREQEIEKVKTLLGELLLRRRFRDSLPEEYAYRLNGKRSGPSDTDTDSKLKERQYILRQLLRELLLRRRFRDSLAEEYEYRR